MQSFKGLNIKLFTWPLVSLSLIGFLSYFLITQNCFYSVDTSSLNYVLRRWQIENWIKFGEYPLWNQNLFGGIYHTASPVLGLYSPLMSLYLIFDDYSAQQYAISFLLLFSSLGMYLLVKAHSKSYLAAMYGAIAFPFSGYVLSIISNYPYFASIAIAPSVLWAHHLLKKSPTLLKSFFLALLLSWIIAEGGLLFSAFLWILLLCDQIFYKYKTSSFLSLLGSFVLAISLTAIIWIPALEVMQIGRRAQQLSFQDASFFSLSPHQLIASIIPSFWGYFYDGTFWGQHLVSKDIPFSKRFFVDSIFLGVPTLLIFINAIFNKTFLKKQWLYFLFVLFFLVLSMGSHTPLHHLFYNFMPFYGKFRFPAHLFSFVNLFLILISCLAILHIPKEKIKGLFLQGGLVYLSIVFILIFIENQHPASGNMRINIIINIILGPICLLIYLMNNKRKKNNMVISAAAFLVIMSAELISLSPPIQTKSLQEINLQEKQSELTKVLFTHDSPPFFRVVRDMNLDRFSIIKENKTGTLKHNWGILKNIQYVFGYEPSVPVRIDSITGDQIFKNLKRWAPILSIQYLLSTIKPINVDLKRLFNEGLLVIRHFFYDKNMIILEWKKKIKYISYFYSVKTVTNQKEALKTILNYNTPEELLIIESKDGTNFQIPKGDKSKPPIIKLTKKTNNFREFIVNTEAPFFMVVNESFSEGWKAYIGGIEVPIHRANYFNMAVAVPKKKREIKIRFVFMPKGFSWGRSITLITLTIMLIMTLLKLIMSFFSKSKTEIRQIKL